MSQTYLVQNAQAYGSRGIHVWVVEALGELALRRREARESSQLERERRSESRESKPHLWRSLGVLLREVYRDGIVTPLPYRVLLSGDVALPFHEVDRAVRFRLRSGEEALRVAREGRRKGTRSPVSF